jgi:hypothetical protein
VEISAGLRPVLFPPFVNDRAGDMFRLAAGALYSFLNRFPVREMDDHDPMIALYARADRVWNAPVIHVGTLPESWKALQSTWTRNGFSWGHPTL